MKRLFNCAVAGLFFGFFGAPLASAAIEEALPEEVQTMHYKLSYHDAEEAIGFALADKGVGAKISAKINGQKEDSLFSYSKPISVEIRSLKYDPQLKRWNASLVFISDTQVVSALPVSGRYDEMTEMAVLKRQMKNGDIISEKDVELKDYPVSSVRGAVITDIASLIGKSPARTISAARPIRAHEIVGPTLIKKNAIVSMKYSSLGMEITAPGQAMEEGSKGNIISVRNIASKKLVRAMVTDNDTVEVSAPNTQASQLTQDSIHETN